MALQGDAPGDSLGLVVTAIPAMPDDLEALRTFAAAAAKAYEAEAKLGNAIARESAETR